MLTNLTLTQFLDETASNSPAPGGGSISALAAALGAALTSMVCRLTIGKKKYADVQPEMESILKRSEAIRQQATALIDEDTAAFNRVMAAFALPKETDEEKAKRTAAIQAATKDATRVPLRLMEVTADAMGLVKDVAARGNQNSLSDAGVAALVLSAACEGAALNVRINLGGLTDQEFVASTRATMDRIATIVSGQAAEILAGVRSKI